MWRYLYIIHLKSDTCISCNMVSGWTPINCSAQPSSTAQELAWTSGSITGDDIASAGDSMASKEKPRVAGAKSGDIKRPKRTAKRTIAGQRPISKRQKRVTAKKILKDEEKFSELSTENGYSIDMQHSFPELFDKRQEPGNQVACSQYEQHASNLGNLQSRAVYGE